MAGSYFSDIAVQLALLVALTVALNLLLGLAGQMSMATAAFYGIGAYTCAILTATGSTLNGTELIGPGWPYWAGALGAFVASALGGLLVALPAARRLKGEYLMLFTLAFHFLFENIVISWVDVTGGPFGIPVPPIAFLGWQMSTTNQAVPLFLIWVALLAGLALWIVWTPFGLLLRGIREDEMAVESVGKPVVAPKTVIFAFSAALSGVTGALAVGYLGFIAPPTFNMNLAVLVAACVVLGGPGNIGGGVIAASAIGLLRPVLENIGALSADTAIPIQSVVFGAALVLGIMFRPQGLFPERGLRPAGAKASPSRSARAAIPRSVASSADPTCRTPGGANRPGAVLSVRGLSKRFGGLQAVEAVDLDLYAGEIVALVGPNGAGKTTIFNLVTGALPPDRGAITLKGKDISGYDPRRNARLGMVRYFQNVRAFQSLSAIENVALAVPFQKGEALWESLARPRAVLASLRTTFREAMTQLEFVGASSYAYETVRDLAYGQQKLVALGRLLATGAEVILLDEPTAGVDPLSAERIIALVRDLANAGKTICIVEHSLHVVSKLADRIVFMDSGRVIAEGSVEAITTRKDLVALYFGT
jgi:branched-chain amino acid transport system permease protein